MIQLLLLLGVLWGSSSQPYRFILVPEPKSWVDSQLYCRQKHVDLATVQSDEDRLKLNRAAVEAGFTSFAWIGFYNGVLSWRWSYQDELISFTSWASWEPDVPRTQEGCAFLDKNNQWGDDSCEVKKNFFCQTDKGKLSDKFVLISLVVRWREAQLYCRTYHRDLATISDAAENTYLTKVLSSSNVWDAWIGLSKNQWLWSDQTNVSWSQIRWQEGQPDNINGDEECGLAGTEGQIADVTCSNKHSFYCQTPVVRKIQLVRVAVRSAGSLSESAVMEAILKQMNQMLSEQKMNTDSNITQRIQPDGKIFHQHANNTHQTKTTCEDINPDQN